VNNADLVLADGKPVALACKILRNKKQERISGMDFTPLILQKANENKLSVFVYGSTAKVHSAIKEKTGLQYPDISLAGFISPPFRELTENEIINDIEKINQSSAHIVLVAVGCPKQEKWMSAMRSKINATLIGIGGALPVFIGFQKRAPRWMQKSGLEWIFRFGHEPGRLWKRYLITNTSFIYYLIKEKLKLNKKSIFLNNKVVSSDLSLDEANK
jgi:N-acetylglucosaminyldiphosphoundecaprenol N-acetyl-beta-D-mannosaminyltransferase